MNQSAPGLLGTALRTARTCLTSTNHPVNAKGGSPGAVGAGANRGIPGSATRPHDEANQTPHPKPGDSTISNRTSRAVND